MHHSDRVPPGPRGVPLLGSYLSLISSPLAFYRSMTLDYGPVSHARFGKIDFFMPSEPSVIEDLLVGKHKHCVKDATTRMLYPLVGHGLLTSEGEVWKRQRKLAAPAFQPRRLTSYEEAMVACAREAFATFRDGESRDAHADIMRLTLDIVSRTLLGVNTRSEADRIAHALEVSLDYYERRLYSVRRMLPPSFPSLGKLRFRRAKAELDQIVHGIIERCRASAGEGDYLLARLIRARTEQGEAMSEQQLHDEAITMLLAGHETTALALMYCVYALSKSPASAERLRAEVDRELGGRAATGEDLARMPYLDAVLHETLRLYPPAYAFGREVTSEIELGGYRVPVGSQVVISPFGMHRNPRFFPDPERFSPERWLEGGTARSLPRFAYLPFGGGPRICIGSHFAMLEAGLVLATLVQELELDVPRDFTLALAPVITLRSRHGLPVRVRRRARTRGRGADADASARAPHSA